jgi:Flp pilus assembly protein TadD
MSRPATNDPISGHGGQSSDVLIHREILQIAVLMFFAVVGFFLTKAVATSNRQQTLRDAEAWYQQGQQSLSAGRVDEGIASLRRASVRNRYDRKYTLALARALSAKGDTEGARAALVTLRDESPEDTEVNLALARLAAQRDDVTEALRFYHNALYAPWPTEAAQGRREVRFELIDFLLRHDQTGRALAELLAATADLPDDAGVHVRVGQLFERAGDGRHALDQYQRALRLAPADRAALAGAGMCAFALGNFQLARTYLDRAPDEREGVRRTREVVDLVLSSDPLAPRIGSTERHRRLDASLDYLDRRLKGCVAARAAAGGPGSALQQELSALRHRTPSGPLGQDALETSVDLFDRVGRYVSATCPPLSTRDESFTLIARLHATGAK